MCPERPTTPAIKPVDGFVAGWQAIEQALQQRHGSPFRIVVVGGRRRRHGNLPRPAAPQRHACCVRGSNSQIVADTAELLPTHSPGVRRRLARVVRERGIELHLNRKVVAVKLNLLKCQPEEEYPF
jgi:selenide,water dikinase